MQKQQNINVETRFEGAGRRTYCADIDQTLNINNLGQIMLQ